MKWRLFWLVACLLFVSMLVPGVALAAAPANDDFANAVTLSESSGTVLGTNSSATTETGEPSPWTLRSGASVWYSWTPTFSGMVTIDTVGSDFDTMLAVHTGTQVDALTLVAQNDDIGTVLQSRLVFAAVAGTTYRIVVAGYNPSVDPKQGNITLNWHPNTPPTNDLFADALTISGPSGIIAGRNTYATTETAEPNPWTHLGAPSLGGSSVWYAWTPTWSGQASIDTSSSDFDTMLAVYTGDQVGALVLIAENDDVGTTLQSSVDFAAVAGTTYRIAVAGFKGSLVTPKQGNITLNWQQPGAPTYTVSTNAGAHGSIGPNSPTVNHGADQAFTITPDVGYAVASLTVDDESVPPASSYTFTNVTALHTIAATFEPATYSITYNLDGGANPIGAPATYTFGTGASVPTPTRVGFAFGGWYTNPSFTGSPVTAISATDTEDKALWAKWTILTYQVTATSGANGSISPSGMQPVDHGAAQAFTITPDVGYVVADVLVDGVSVGAVTNYTFTGVSSGHTISATFAVPSSVLTLTSTSASSLPYGSAFAVKGTLAGNGAGLVGQQVVLQSAAPGAPFADTTFKATTGDGGVFGFSVNPKTKTYYRVRFAGSVGWTASGPTASVYAKPKVRLTRSTSWKSIGVSKTYYAKGFIAPRHTKNDANKVKIRAYKRASNGKYYYKKSFTASYSYYSLTKTRYKASVKLTSKGRWKLVAYHAADSKNAKTYGSTDYVTVK